MLCLSGKWSLVLVFTILVSDDSAFKKSLVKMLSIKLRCWEVALVGVILEERRQMLGCIVAKRLFDFGDTVIKQFHNIPFDRLDYMSQ